MIAEYKKYPLYDFLMIMIRVADKHLSFEDLIDELNIQKSEEVKAYIQQFKSEIPNFYIREIEFFFAKPFWLTSILIDGILQDQVKDIDILIEYIHALDFSESIYKGLTELLRENANEEIDKDFLKNKIQHTQDLEEYLNQYSVFSQTEKEIMIEVAQYPKDAKERLIRTLKRAYSVYKKFEPQIVQAVDACTKQYTSIIKNNLENFFDQYLMLNSTSMLQEKKVVFVPSYFLEIGSIIYVSEETDDEMHIFFGNDVRKNATRKENIEKRKLFFNAFSEEKRVQIIKKLAYRPYYVHELAKELDLTSATVSYHLNILAKLGILILEKQGHRFYYELKRDRMKDLFDLVYDELLA